MAEREAAAGASRDKDRRKRTLGWKEWVSLPDLGIPVIKAKMDTGARTSALHACSIETFEREGIDMVRFGVHPFQKRTDCTVICEAPVLARRRFRNSGGQHENRYVIRTTLSLGGVDSKIEISLTDREPMLFRMIMGRTALAGEYTVDPIRSYVFSKKKENA